MIGLIGLVIFLILCVIGLGVWDYKLRKEIKRVDDRFTKFLSVDKKIIQRIFPRVFSIVEKHSGTLEPETSKFINEVIREIEEEVERIFGQIF